MTGSNKPTEVAKQRQIWRDSFTFQQAMNQCHETHTNFTVVVLQSGVYYVLTVPLDLVGLRYGEQKSVPHIQMHL